MFRLEIATDNAAFDDDPGGEIARMLQVLATHLRNGALCGRDVVDTASGPMKDVNGNTVGMWQYTPED